jgi:hypothetical protein
MYYYYYWMHIMRQTGCTGASKLSSRADVPTSSLMVTITVSSAPIRLAGLHRSFVNVAHEAVTHEFIPKIAVTEGTCIQPSEQWRMV